MVYDKYSINCYFQIMGNSQNHNKLRQGIEQIEFQRTNLPVLYEFEIGEILSINFHYQTQSTQQSPSPYSNMFHQGIIFYRAISLPSKQLTEKVYRNIESYQHRQNAMEDLYICKFLSMQKKVKNNMCANMYSLDLFLEVSETTLWDQIQARVQSEMRYFDIIDCIKIITASIKALHHIESEMINFKFEGIENIMNRVFINPNRIFLLSSGLIKIIHPLMVSPYDRYQYRTSCYYSPEKLADFDFDDDIKSAIFQLGMTLLHLFTLSDCHEIYNGFQVQQQLIDSKIQHIWDLYHNRSVCQLLSKMTRVIRSRRATLQDCLSYVQILKEELQFYLPKLDGNLLDTSNFKISMNIPTTSCFPSSRSENNQCKNKAQQKHIQQQLENKIGANLNSCLITEQQTYINQPNLHLQLQLLQSGLQSIPLKNSFLNEKGQHSYKYGQQLDIMVPLTQSTQILMNYHKDISQLNKENIRCNIPLEIQDNLSENSGQNSLRNRTRFNKKKKNQKSNSRNPTMQYLNQYNYGSLQNLQSSEDNQIEKVKVINYQPQTRRIIKNIEMIPRTNKIKKLLEIGLCSSERN